jgi:WXG100 family type VII secretion target
MPDDIVRAEYDELARLVQQFYGESDYVGNLTNQIKYLVDGLECGGWVGMGARAFYDEMYHDVIPGLERLIQALCDAGDSVNQISRIIRQAEEEAAAIFSRDGHASIVSQQAGSAPGVQDGYGQSSSAHGAHVLGAPGEMERYYQIQSGPTCGVQASENVLRAFGINASVNELWNIAKSDDRQAVTLLGLVFPPALLLNALYLTPGGTNFNDISQMLNGKGIGTDSHPSFGTADAAVGSLLGDLQQGRGVIATIDVGPLSYWKGQQGGHAVWITGVRYDDQGTITHVICNDSGYWTDHYDNGSFDPSTGSMIAGGDGKPDGQGIEYPIDEFLQAWQKRSFGYISTQKPIPTAN